MVGIVIVSHSAKLAEGLKELAQQMTQTSVPIAIAAGIDDPENPFGTDALQIQAAIASVYSDTGVVVLMDLGSAILSTEMALEFLSQDQRSNVRLCDAPLVEGVLAAVVQASTGASLEQVIAEARSALAAKTTQLFDGILETQTDEQSTQSQTMQEIYLTIQNTLGIHARPAAKFVAIAAQFRSQISVQNLTTHSHPVSAKSINQVITLGMRQGHEILITAVGDDAESALDALKKLVEENFGEPLSDHKLPHPSDFRLPSSDFFGISASPGIAVGEIILYQPSFPEIIAQKTENPRIEWQQLQLALQTAKGQIQSLINSLSGNNSDIFEAHLLYLEDPALLNQAQQLIFEQHLTAATAWKKVIEDMISQYQTLEDSYLKARVADVKDIGMRVLRLLTGISATSLDCPHPGILVALELTPSEVAQLDTHQILGICTAAGSATAHSALIANMIGIPMVVAVGSDLLTLAPGTTLALEGEIGQIWVNPNKEHLKSLEAKRKRIPKNVPLEAKTLDGQKIPVLANILGVTDAQFALDCGAEGVGLLRTEFLYLDRLTPPTEVEQLEIYHAIAQRLKSRPLTIRTLDIGGDKPIPYLNLEPEVNPFLGWRGIRQSLDSPEMLKTQLRAILRASHKHNIKLMFPMVASVREVRAAKTILREVQTELRAANIPFDAKMKVGMMIEVPAAVIMADHLAKEVDFFSIGTNDLSQYTMAADRTNPKVAKLIDGFEPAVLRIIQQTVTIAHQAGILVSLCGQIASNPEIIPILLGLGIDELSVNPPAISSVKAVISQLTIEQAKAIAHTVVQLDSAEAVREYCQHCLKKQG